MSRGRRVQPRRPAPPWLLPLAVCLCLALAGLALLLCTRGCQAPEPPGEPPAPQADPEPEPEPEPTPEPPPPPPPEPSELLLAEMSLHEKVCQLFVVSTKGLTGVSGATAAGETTRAALEAWPVAGVIYDRTNLKSMDQAQAMLSGIQGYSKIPLFLTCDEEGGRVNRVMKTLGTTYFGPMLNYREEGAETARSNARTIASDLKSVGFNMDLAPVADVWSNPANTVIGDRAYSTDFQEAAELVAAAVEGFHEGGTACVLKHFPGHGDTSGDSHFGSVYVHKTLDELRGAELLPFRAGIEAGADAVMMGHLILDQIDDQPALLSYRIVTELLRQELGFEGVVITDDLQMQAMSDHYGSGELAVGAIQAGVDLLLCPMDLETAVGALTEAVEDGRISRERLDESVLRVLQLKQSLGLLSEAREDPEAVSPDSGPDMAEEP